MIIRYTLCKGGKIMKKRNRALSAVMVLVLMVSALAFPVHAAGGKEVKMLNYNVAGLPRLAGLIGKDDGSSRMQDQTALSKLLNAADYDVIAVQEDFGAHYFLASGLIRYPYKTVHSGGVPGGDGMNIFSKYPIYNAVRTPWDKTYGIIEDGADELTPKGILYAVLDLGDGIQVDFYDIHADAFGDAGSVAARRDNFRQLAALIQSRGTARPVIVTGDFNTSSHLSDGDSFTSYLIDQCGLKDAWTELYNGGNYSDYSSHYSKGGYWGNWDSVEKFLYRDGGGVHVDAQSFEYIDYKRDGSSISDHNAASAVLRFTKTEDYAANSDKLSVTRPKLGTNLVNTIKSTVKDLGKVLSYLFKK